jgi:hypothetical protein
MHHFVGLSESLHASRDAGFFHDLHNKEIPEIGANSDCFT